MYVVFITLTHSSSETPFYLKILVKKGAKLQTYSFQSYAPCLAMMSKFGVDTFSAF